MKPPRGREVVDPPERRTNWTIVVLLAGLVLLLAIVAFFENGRSPNQDKLTKSEVTPSTAPNREKLCASNSTYDLIKRELFRRAAEVRGSDQAAYDKLAGYAVVRMDNPVEESEDNATSTVNCSGSLSLDLPPGVALVGGRQTLMSQVDYAVAAAANGSSTLVALRNADSIITQLATLTRVREADTRQPEDVLNNGSADLANSAVPETGGTATSSSRPSFDCATARSRAELAICNDAGLGALDRQTAAQYAHASAVASPEQRVILRNTAHRFEAYRDSCPDNACVGGAYISRLREIRDIVEGRWRPSQ